MDFETLLQYAKTRLDTYMALLIQAKENPDVILTDLFRSGSENLLTHVVEQSPELIGETVEIHELQDYLYQLLVPHLSRTLKDFEFIYDSNRYPAPLSLCYGEEEVGILNIYEKKFIIARHSIIAKEKTKLASMEAEYETLLKGMQEYEGYKNNILSYAKNPLQKAQIVFRKKHFEKEVLNKYKDYLEASMEVEQRVISQRLAVERLRDEIKPFENMQYSVAESFSAKYGYEIVTPE
ncbi:hypothetical protein PP175_26585 (plasmid) [Aneurinibacillus sp. Ricciae_BoGa-3]|uniref:hypothetical protein n=1 Tax=Aneurinibacillus sp. Ricciae_BoGa-3 TaxID=3022697 RepID=UPI002341A8CD|nr:hypothetical protein [Aneurinibacillus sp. Ricciae_BoGa-3]WCK57633.1 hypothetical protein PP175_26585 [Aneurinibacillus sp. Ricciae_BoGa-3]